MTSTSNKPVSALFRHIETLQNDTPWGAFLDAGTGDKSLRWARSLDTESCTAVTASARMAEQTLAANADSLRPQDRLVTGVWEDPELLKGQQFDTVLLDYLIGAIDGFTPYWQDLMFDRIRPHVRGRLYIIGLKPYVPYSSDTEVGRYVGDLGRLRDACLLLAGERPYREFPSDWVMRHLEKAGFRVTSSDAFAIRYRQRFVDGQLNMCRQRLRRFADPILAQAMLAHIGQMQHRGYQLLEKYGALAHGHDYVISAEPA